MKTQLLGVGVSLCVHAIIVWLLFSVSQGFSPGIRTLALDLSFEATGPMGMAGPQMENAHPLPEASMPGGKTSTSGTVAIPNLPVENTLNAADAETPPIPPELQPRERMQPQPVKPDPSPEPKALEPKKLEPVPQSPLLEPDLPEPKKQKQPPETVSAITAADKAKAPIDRDRSQGDGRAGAETNSENNLSKTMAGQVNPGRGVLLANAGETNPGIADSKGENVYLATHFDAIRRRLAESLCYPNIARQRGWSGKVLVAFTVHPNGLVDHIEIKKSCGISLLDKSALATVRNLSPFPKPPMAIRISLPILYQLN